MHFTIPGTSFQEISPKTGDLCSINYTHQLPGLFPWIHFIWKRVDHPVGMVNTGLVVSSPVSVSVFRKSINVKTCFERRSAGSIQYQ